MAQERGFDRLVNFSDAIVAIAATLLVLPLVDKASAIGSTPIPQFLQENSIAFIVFVLSFVVIGRFWLAHHRFFEHLRSFSSGLMLFNLLWLLGMAIVARRNHSILHDPEKYRKAFVLSVATTVVTGIAFLISLIWPMIGLWALWLLLLTPVLSRVVERPSGTSSASVS